jgi:ATP-dependent Zn protease
VCCPLGRHTVTLFRQSASLPSANLPLRSLPSCATNLRAHGASELQEHDRELRRKGRFMDLIQTAVHEAAHAVIAHALGLATKSLALTHHEADQTGVLGTAEGPRPDFGYDHASLQSRQRAMRDECVAACAGLAAEHVFFGVPLTTENENAQGDFRNIFDLESDGMRIPGKRRGYVGDDATWLFIERSLKKATSLVRSERERIRRVADELLKRGRLEMSELQPLLDE